MEIPATILEKLICDKCVRYLSRGPILISDSGKNLCGRCAMVTENSKKNIPYEELAKLVKFPCSYEKYGCKEKITFEENEIHEDICNYRTFVCPFAEFKSCDWIGVSPELLEHCQVEHPKNLVQNAIKLKHDIGKSIVKKYLLSAFQVLFLIQTKVCVITKATYHSVKLIGDSKRAAKYSFSLDIENKSGKLYKQKLVSPQGLQDLEINACIVTEIDILINFLGCCRISDIMFTITVQPTNGASLEKIEEEMRKLEMQVVCVNCQYKTEPIWRDGKGWYCNHCAPDKRPCKNHAKGCKHSDICIKNKKHQYFCENSKYCMLCKKYITQQNINSHYSQTHLDIIQNPGTTWTITVSNEPKWRIITADFGKALCHYWVYGSKFFMYVRMPLPSDQLFRYKCMVEISHPVSGRSMTWTMHPQYFYVWDYEILTPDENVYGYVCSSKINVNVDFFETVNTDIL